MQPPQSQTNHPSRALAGANWPVLILYSLGGLIGLGYTSYKIAIDFAYRKAEPKAIRKKSLNEFISKKISRFIAGSMLYLIGLGVVIYYFTPFVYLTRKVLDQGEHYNDMLRLEPIFQEMFLVSMLKDFEVSENLIARVQGELEEQILKAKQAKDIKL